MSAGLPGLGLGGIFFVVSALLAPLFELVRLARGTSTPARRRQIARQFAMALAMIIAVDLALRAVLLVASAAGVAAPAAAEGLSVVPLAPLGITGAILAGLLLASKAAHLALSVRPLRRAIFRGRVLVTLAVSGARGSGGS
jgi:hypothetical protein